MVNEKCPKIIILILAVLSLLSCTKKPGRTIDFWDTSAEPGFKRSVEKIILEFEKKEHCKVNIHHIYESDVISNPNRFRNNQSSANILSAGCELIPYLAESGYILPFDDKNLKDFSTFNGILNNSYGKLWFGDIRVFFCNTGILKKSGLPQEPPKSMSELLNAAGIADNPPYTYGFGAIGKDMENLYEDFLLFCYSFGGRVSQPGNIPSVNSRENSEALNFYNNLARNGTIETQKETESMFINGKIAFCIAGAAFLEKLKNMKLNFQFKTFAVPSHKKNRGFSVLKIKTLSVCSETNDRKIAGKFIKYLSDKAEEIYEECTEAGIPATSEFLKKLETGKDENFVTISKQFHQAMIPPTEIFILKNREHIENGIIDALYAKRGTYQVLADAQKIINSSLKTRK